MKTQFTAKYLQHLSSKKKDGGFTLIELLVVIIIVGVLAAIALPSFLNQIGKARGSEAKSNLGTINRAQQAFRLERGEMADALTDLDAQISGKFYAYNIPDGADQNNAAALASVADAGDDLKTYSSAVVQVPGDADGPEFFGSIICESVENNTDPVAGDAPEAEGEEGACPDGFLVVE